MPHSALPTLTTDPPQRDRPTLPPYTQTLTPTQCFPRVVVAVGIALTAASGVAGLVTAFGCAA
jgi:hypothetical protein